MSAKPKPPARALTAEERKRDELAGQPEQAEVAALRKRLRGELLTAEEKAILERASRKPDGPTVPHSEIERLLAERVARGE